MTAQGLITDGPFIVQRVKPTPHPYSANERVLSRRAVANQEDARAECHAILRRLPVKVAKPGYGLPLGPGGGTVPLPDGSEIHVEAKTWERLAREAQVPPPGRLESTTAYVLWAWNDRCGVAAQEKGGER